MNKIKTDYSEIEKPNILYNIGIITDISWDNYLMLSNILNKLDADYYRLHTLYYKNTWLIQRSNSMNMTTLITHASDDIYKSICNLFNVVDFWIIFTNHIEYLTPSSLIYEKCLEFNFNHIIVTEYSKSQLIYNIEQNVFNNFKHIENKKIKKFLKFVLINSLKFKKIIIDFKQFNDDYNILYNEIHKTKNFPELNFSTQDILKIQDKYNKINASKHKIKVLYDKKEAKVEKMNKKMLKQQTFIEFTTNRNKFINSFKNQ